MLCYCAGGWPAPLCYWFLCLGSITLYLPSPLRTSARESVWCLSSASDPSRWLFLHHGLDLEKDNLCTDCGKLKLWCMLEHLFQSVCFLSLAFILRVSSGFCGGRPLLFPEWRGKPPLKLLLTKYWSGIDEVWNANNLSYVMNEAHTFLF